MSKRKLPKVKVSKDTGNTIIKVAGLGLVAFFAYKMLGKSETGGLMGGGLMGGGYSGSGTDLSGILPFLQETPPVFNISNTPPSNFGGALTPEQITAVIDGTSSKKDITANGGALLETGWSANGADWIKPNDTIGNFIRSTNPSNWGQTLSEEQYKSMSDNYSKYSIFKGNNPIIKIIANAWNSPINPFNLPSVSANSNCIACKKLKDEVYGTQTVEITEFKPSKFYSVSDNQSKSFTTAQSYLTDLRQGGFSPTTVNYTKKERTVFEEVDFFNNVLAPIERQAQNKLATSLASGNCGPAICTNACSGTKKSVNYATTVSSGTRYYENSGTSLTRSDLIVSS